jgi:ATP-binding cassette subfamily F protein uup
LLLALAQRPNVLLLDEPTNDLDLETIRLIEEFLRQWSGTVVVVSHDRTFLSRTTDRLLEVHRDGSVSDVPGGIDAWIMRAAPMTAAATASASDVVVDAATVPKGRALRDAEKEMTRLERRRRTLEEKILLTSDYEHQRRLGTELDEVGSALAAAEDRWLALQE